MPSGAPGNVRTYDASRVKVKRPTYAVPVDIDDLPSDGKIYVRNLVQGDYVLTIFPGNGSHSVHIRVEETWIPRLITGEMSAANLKESDQFRRALSRGLLEIVPIEEAEKILKTHEARCELERLRVQYSELEYVDSREEVSPIQAMRDNMNPNVRLEVKDALSREDLDDDIRLAHLLQLHMTTPMTPEELDFILVTVSPQSNIYSWANTMKNHGR
jgi:hypothetical protein